jgi:hypothetical protein
MTENYTKSILQNWIESFNTSFPVAIVKIGIVHGSIETSGVIVVAK